MRRRAKRRARGAWVAAFVVVALIGALAAAQFGSSGGTATPTTPATGTAAGAGGGSAGGTAAGAAGSGGTAAAGTSASGGGSGATATAGAATRQGGPLAIVQQYFGALAAADYPGAYALLAPAYQRAHTLAVFVRALPARAPRLVSSTLTSVANFHATAQLVIAAAGGAQHSESVQLLDVNAAATRGSTASWRLLAPPAGAGA